MRNLIFYLIVTLSFSLYSLMGVAASGVKLNHLNIAYGDGGGEQDDRFYLAGASVFTQVVDNQFLQLDLERTQYEDAGLNELSFYYIYRSTQHLFSLGYKYQELDAFESNHALFQYRYYQDDFFTVVGLLGYEDKNITDDYNYGALYLRLYPVEQLMIQTGPSFYHIQGGDFGSEDIELDLTIEWQPDHASMPCLTLYYEEDLFGNNSIGVRFRMEKAGLRTTHRTGGFTGL